jgi:hypothetical protein
MLRIGSTLLVLLLFCSTASQASRIVEVRQQSDGEIRITLMTAPASAGDTIKIMTAKTAGQCAKGTDVTIHPDSLKVVGAGPSTSVLVEQSAIGAGNYICAEIDHAGSPVASTPEVTFNPGCATPGPYSDCTFDYMLIGGIEQSDLSAQNTVTQGFYDLFLRRPKDSQWASIWFRSRYLGAPSSSSTQNVVAAASNPTGTLTASNLPQSVNAVDYTLGLQFDGFQRSSTGIRRFTYSPVVGFGATTPLSATTTVSGFAVPQYGTNECTQLHQRFVIAYGYNPPLPPSGVYDSSGDIGCVVQPNPRSTATNPLPGTQITDIAFSNEDRSSFLLKWGTGVRVIDRYAPNCSSTDGCPRLVADFTVGQDQAITRGEWRHFIFKADAIIPIMSTGFYFFATSANRFEKNMTLSPLILSPVTVNSSTASACTSSSSTVCVPSPNVFVLPYKQPDRDFYSIGVGIDLVKVFTKLFTPPK